MSGTGRLLEEAFLLQLQQGSEHCTLQVGTGAVQETQAETTAGLWPEPPTPAQGEAILLLG